MASAVVASAVVASAVVLSGMFVIRSQPSAALFGTSCRFSQARSTFHGYDTIVAWPRRRTKVRDCKVQSLPTCIGSLRFRNSDLGTTSS